MFILELEINDHPKNKQHRFAKIVKEVMGEAVQAWRDKFLSSHFEQGADRKYKYKKRKENYLKRKRKRKSNPPDMVFTGKSRDTLTKAFRFRVTPSGKGKVVGKFTVGSLIKYFWMKKPDQPYLPEEMKKITVKERNAIKKYIEENVADRMNKVKGRKTVVR